MSYIISGSSVTLTILTVFLSVAILLASLVLALLFYFLRQKKLVRRLANSTSKPMIKPAALPMLSSRSLLQLKQSNFYDRLYSDSDDSGTAMARWGAQQRIDDQLDQSVDELSDEYPEGRSSSLVSSSSGDGWFVNSREESNNNGLLHTPASSTTSSPIMASQACILNLSLKYNFHQGSLIVLVINASSPPKQSSSTKGLFVVVQLFQTRQNGETEDKEMILKTDTKPYSTNVLFNEELKYDNLPHNELDATSIKLSLCSYDRFSRVQALGDFIVDLHEISHDPVQPIVLQRRMQQVSCVSHTKSYFIFILFYCIYLIFEYITDTVSSDSHRMKIECLWSHQSDKYPLSSSRMISIGRRVRRWC